MRLEATLKSLKIKKDNTEVIEITILFHRNEVASLSEKSKHILFIAIRILG